MISRRFISPLGTLALLALTTGVASAQAVVTLPDTSQQTTLSANVSEQCRIIVPAGIAFAVTDISAATAASGAAVTIDNIVLATASKKLKVSLQANAASFLPSVGGAITWSASDVSWAVAAWTNATGAAGTLSAGAYNEVATSAAGVAAMSTTALVFTLAPKTTVQRSGSHTLVMTWKVESI
jgi:hypothetical protein